MSNTNTIDRPSDRWATFRLAVIGPLLATPAQPGDLQARLIELAARAYTHPITGEPVSFGVSTIERWYYTAHKTLADAVSALRRRVRSDAGTRPSLTERQRVLIQEQHKRHPGWTYQLHWDNLRARAKADPGLGEFPSYPTVRRYMRSVGLYRKKRRHVRDTAGAREAAARLENRETRSFEVATVNGLWHLDFHQGSRRILLANGDWAPPQLLGLLDDCSRLACHAQWYLDETAQVLVHGVSQAFQKRGLPWALMSDRGAAMQAAEYVQGLKRLGVSQEMTLPYSPHQNGKQESFWGQIEGRVLAMLEDVSELTLELLNEATQAWVEMEYNRKVHSELGVTPLARFLQGPYVGRESPASEELRRLFRREESRSQRTSDGTVSISGRRFEVPSRYRHARRVNVRYAKWDLSAVDLVDGGTGRVVAPLYPQDKVRNADGQRRTMEPVADVSILDAGPQPDDGIAPLLRQLMAEYAATGLAPAYIPIHPVSKEYRDADEPPTSEESE